MSSEPPPNKSTVLFWRNAMWVSIGLVLVPPLLGLSGTVSGMIDAFKDLSEPGMGDPTELSENISVALTPTVIGLVVSVAGVICLLICLIRYLNLKKRYEAVS